MQQRSTGDGVLLSFPFVRLVQQVKMINLKAHMQLKQKAGQILLYDESHHENTNNTILTYNLSSTCCGLGILYPS